jgi:hypothetical protein
VCGELASCYYQTVAWVKELSLKSIRGLVRSRGGLLVILHMYVIYASMLMRGEQEV